MKKLKVVGQSKDDDGNIIGKYDSNHMLNTMVYAVEFPYGPIRKYGEILITANMSSQGDSKDYRTPSSL